VEKKYKIKIPEEYLTKVTSVNNMVDVAKKILSENRIICPKEELLLQG